jgi:hypothetical protein
MLSRIFPAESQLLRLALPAESQLLHWCGGWIAVRHLSQLENALGVVCLAEGDALSILAHLDAEVEAEEAEVAHVELLIHRGLEALHFSWIGAGDDEVVNVYADQQDSAPVMMRSLRSS